MRFFIRYKNNLSRYISKNQLLLLLGFMLLGIKPVYSKNILDLQKYKTQEKQVLKDNTKIELINLNPNVGFWYLYKYRKPSQSSGISYHLELPYPDMKISLDKKDPGSIIIETKQDTYLCSLIDTSIIELISKSNKTNNPYTSICEGRVYIITKTSGRESTKEYVVDFLRRNIWGADTIAAFVKDVFFFDKYLVGSKSSTLSGKKTNHKKGFPLSAKTQEISDIATDYLGISYYKDGELWHPTPPKEDIDPEREPDDSRTVQAGQWYQTEYDPHVFVSVMKPSLIQESILKSYPKLVNALDPVENEATSYFIAFDLKTLNINFKLGTDHPSAEWSTRVQESMIDNPKGPDGIDSFLPLISSGKVNPAMLSYMVATFTGGFKRNHSAFMWGALATKNKGSHYGFMQEGVLFSTLNPELATIYMDTSGDVRMSTWTKDDDKLIPKLKFARQNGVSLIESVDSSGIPIPGKYVKYWGAGNWSGSEQKKQRALRAGICLQETGSSKFLIYGYFSSVTPNAMARLFQAYGCKYAMHLDMNALEHTYLALYKIDPKSNSVSIEHLVQGMEVLDKKNKDTIIPRFLGMSDNRDFFTITRKD